MISLNTILYLIANRLFKMMSISMLFFSNKGIKCLNHRLSSDLFDSYDILDYKTISPNELYIAYVESMLISKTFIRVFYKLLLLNSMVFYFSFIDCKSILFSSIILHNFIILDAQSLNIPLLLSL